MTSKVLTACLLLGSLFAQNEVIVLSQKVGTEINVEENLFYRIFPGEKGFVNAQIVQVSNNKFEIRIVKDTNDGPTENIKLIGLKEFAALQNYVNGQPDFTAEAKIAMYEGLDYLKAELIVKEIPKPQYVKVKHSGGKKLKGTLIKVDENILHVQTPTSVETVHLRDVDAISYRMTLGEFDYIKPYLFGLSGVVGLVTAQIYNSQRSPLYNEYGIARTDLSRYTQLSGIVIGLIFSSELFDAISTLLTPSETFILSKETYESHQQN